MKLLAAMQVQDESVMSRVSPFYDYSEYFDVYESWYITNAGVFDVQRWIIELFSGKDEKLKKATSG